MLLVFADVPLLRCCWRQTCKYSKALATEATKTEDHTNYSLSDSVLEATTENCFKSSRFPRFKRFFRPRYLASRWRCSNMSPSPALEKPQQYYQSIPLTMSRELCFRGPSIILTNVSSRDVPWRSYEISWYSAVADNSQTSQIRPFPRVQWLNFHQTWSESLGPHSNPIAQVRNGLSVGGDSYSFRLFRGARGGFSLMPCCNILPCCMRPRVDQTTGITGIDATGYNWAANKHASGKDYPKRIFLQGYKVHVYFDSNLACDWRQLNSMAKPLKQETASKQQKLFLLN